MNNKKRFWLSLHPASQWILITASSILLALTLYDDIARVGSSPVLWQDGFPLYAFSVVLTFLGAVFPLLLVLTLFQSAKKFRKQDQHNRPCEPLTGSALFLRCLGVLLLALTALAFFYLLERVIPFSVTPFATAVCGLFFLAIGWIQMRRLKSGFRLAVLSVGLLFVLSMKYLDWNSRKPFLRDLYRVRVGMTIDEVEHTMRGYLNKPKPEDPDRVVQANDEMIYRPSNEAAYNADCGIIVIQDGRVEAVGYSAD